MAVTIPTKFTNMFIKRRIDDLTLYTDSIYKIVIAKKIVFFFLVIPAMFYLIFISCAGSEPTRSTQPTPSTIHEITPIQRIISIQPPQNMPKIAVYVFGAEDALNKAMTTQLITALTNSGRYQTIDNYKEFFKQIALEPKDGAASINSNQIKTLGRQFGVQSVCVAEIITIFGEKQLSAYILDVEKAEVTAMGASDVTLKTSADLPVASENIVRAMFKNAPTPIISRPGTLTDNRNDRAYNPTPKPKAAVYIMGTPEGRDALRMAVNTFLVKSGRYQMIAVDAIDVVAQEHKRQMSGSVSDAQIAKLGEDAGAQYVCVVERTELDGYSYVATRMVSVQTKVAEFADMVELPHGGKIIDIIQWQIGSMLGMTVGPRPQLSTQKSKEEIQAEIQRLEQKKREEQTSRSGNTAVGYTASVPVKTEPPIQGTIVPGGSLTEKLAWLDRSADSHNTYIIEATADESIAPHTFYYNGTINITIVLRGGGENRTIRLKSHGKMFTVKPNITFILDNNITLLGHSGNTESLVYVYAGTFKMNAGATITGNSGGGVNVWGGNFEMNGGIISNNGGGGVGVHGGGGIFTMAGGIINGNTAREGGGVSIVLGTFNMRGGTISGNTAIVYGGGVYVGIGGKINKLGGIITGNSSDPTNGNAVKDGVGNALARKGHAVYVDENWRKETTAGPGENLSYERFGVRNGAWDK